MVSENKLALFLLLVTKYISICKYINSLNFDHILKRKQYLVPLVNLPFFKINIYIFCSAWNFIFEQIEHLQFGLYTNAKPAAHGLEKPMNQNKKLEVIYSSFCQCVSAQG